MIPWANELSAEIVKRIRTARPLLLADKQTPNSLKSFRPNTASVGNRNLAANPHTPLPYAWR